MEVGHMLYTPHARVFLSAVPVFSGTSAISGFFEVEDPRWAARAWELAERDQRRIESASADAGAGENRVTRLMRFVRAQRAAA
jgi:hypothetical protein